MSPRYFPTVLSALYPNDGVTKPLPNATKAINGQKLGETVFYRREIELRVFPILP